MSEHSSLYRSYSPEISQMANIATIEQGRVKNQNIQSTARHRYDGLIHRSLPASRLFSYRRRQ
ncbi:hypothetical protein [Caballeronia fortuita]|uniref:hypothetical protein n=1 Tax=Caballeronia fortuita TaxID=1777138 RepID=UPI0012FE26ED|nr:hypothetical protein [Caballeronia fortuita]